MRFSGISLASILAIGPIVHALPAIPSKVSTAASEFVSAVCTAPSKQFNAVELDIASLFCSGFLHVKTATVSVTLTSVLAAETPAAVHKTITVTNTGYSSLTTTLSTTTSTTLPAVTSYATQDVTPPAVTNTILTTITPAESIIPDTLAPVSITVFNTDTDVSTSTITTFTTQTNIAETFVKRQAAPIAFESYAASVVSQACSCLVHTPTATVSFKATSTPAPLVASTVTTSTFTSTNIVVEASAIDVITDTLPAPTIQATVTTTLATPFTSVTQTITADALTSTQTITPSPVTVTSQTTTYTTAVATATTVVVDTREYEFHLVNGPNNGCLYDPDLQSGFLGYLNGDDGVCADYCARTSGCVAYTTALYVPGGGTACYIFSGLYQAQYLDCGSDSSDYNNEVVYNLVGVNDIYSK